MIANRFGAISALVLGVAASQGAWAADCSTYTNVSGGGSGVATSATLNTTNVSLNGVFSDDCAGHFDTGSASLADAVTTANTASLFGLNDWLGAAKVDSGGATSATFSGLKFELVNVSGFNATNGSFTIKVTDTNGAAPANLPATMDFAVMLSKGQGINDFYFFNDEVVTTSNPGIFTVGFTNNNGNLQGLSHIDLLVRDIRNEACAPTDPQCNPQQIPEPATLPLLTGALLTLGWMARRRRG